VIVRAPAIAAVKDTFADASFAGQAVAYAKSTALPPITLNPR
jgi:hypothetical protein